jgi:hypothetical protein
MLKLKAFSGGIPKKLIETIITCPEEEMGSHSNNPCSIAIIIY